MTTNGTMHFKHLYDVAPWPGWAIMHKLSIKETSNRRLLKSHDPYNYLNHIKKGKILFLIRNPLDVLVSLHHHAIDYYQEGKAFKDWAQQYLESWYKYNEAWLKNKNKLDILYLNYEDTISNKEKQIKRIADFADIQLNPDIIERTLERSSFEFMKKHEQKFGEQPNEQKVYNNFIRKGKTGEGLRTISKEIQEELNKIAHPYFSKNEVTERYYKK